MRRNEYFFILIYLSCSFALILFLISFIFHVLGYWVNGGGDVIELIKSNVTYYLKMAGVGFVSGFLLWLLKIR